jgi:hypothetical protein
MRSSAQSNSIIRRGRLLTVVLLCSAGCLHNVDLVLNNATPKVSLPTDTLVRSIFYPESTLCTLQVADKNDTILYIDSSWPGSSRWIATGLTDKSLVLTLGGSRMGIFSGTSTVFDNRGACDTFSYAITKQFVDSFNRECPGRYWHLYSPLDTAFVHCKAVSRDDALMQFLFPAQNGLGQGPRSAGAFSAFSLMGDFCCSVEITISNGQWTGVETAFFVSTSSEIGRAHV